MWIYLPASFLKHNFSTEYHSAPAMPASTSACTSPNQPIELWLSSSGKATRRPLSWPGWLTRPWAKLLSGTILDPLTAARGASAFISSLPAIRVSRSATRASGVERKILVTSGPKSPALPTKCGPGGSSAKTSRDISLWDLPTSQQAFAHWATRQRRACLQREKRAQATGVAGSSCWPTPTASDAGYFPDLVLAPPSIRFGRPSGIPDASGGQYSTSNAARVWTVFFSSRKKHLCSRPARLTLPHGNNSCVAGLISNPRFYELIMGWPIGWTAPGEQVTEFPAWLQRSRGQFSKLLTSFQAEPS